MTDRWFVSVWRAHRTTRIGSRPSGPPGVPRRGRGPAGEAGSRPIRTDRRGDAP
jgi:hypothetical protein